MANKPQNADVQATDSNALIDAKIENLKHLQAQGVNPYPYRFEVTAHAGELQKKYESLEKGAVTEERVSVAGRIMAYRNSGMFIDLRDSTGNVSVKCEFCSTEYVYDDSDLDRIYASAA